MRDIKDQKRIKKRGRSIELENPSDGAITGRKFVRKKGKEKEVRKARKEIEIEGGCEEKREDIQEQTLGIYTLYHRYTLYLIHYDTFGLTDAVYSWSGQELKLSK